MVSLIDSCIAAGSSRPDDPDGATGALNSFDPLRVAKHLAGEELERMQRLDKSHVEPEEEVFLVAAAWVDEWLVRKPGIANTLAALCVAL